MLLQILHHHYYYYRHKYTNRDVYAQTHICMFHYAYTLHIATKATTTVTATSAITLLLYSAKIIMKEKKAHEIKSHSSIYKHKTYMHTNINALLKQGV